MGLNIVEAFIVAASAEIASRRVILSTCDTSYIETLALEVVAAGMKKSGFRFKSGILRDWGHFYEGLAGVTWLKAQGRIGG